MRSIRVKRTLSRARHAAIGGAIGGAVGGVANRRAASTGAAIGALVGAIVGETRIDARTHLERVKETGQERIEGIQQE